ncbi:response regulator transcription factor [Raoultibacter phocaeensis]|uniref:response regulator transcription factor n=1 Tax=Raoultibacter phocaeensis TaxID=2479841 RepID=UPI00111BA1A7|nr:response regulator transcription factor [Raoultibacter phocaeensis]
MTERSILVVEDDSDINALLATIMRRQGFEVVQAFSGTEGLLRVESGVFDLVLLDMLLPGMDGAAFIERLRTELASSVPVIVVSAKVGLADKIDALALGADDYVTKPFEPEEVVARVQAVLRRSCGTGRTAAAAEAGEVYSHRGLELNATTRRVALGAEDVVLTASEFDILLVLIKAPDKVFSRELLYELVWRNGYYGEDNAINVHVSNIRKKLAAVCPDEEFIKTVWGIGFKLV